MKRVVLFTLAGKNFALHLEQMVHIGQDMALFRLPRLPHEIAGVVVMAETLIPVLHAGVLVGHEEGGAESSYKYSYSLVIDSEYGNICLPADTVWQIVAVDKGGMSPAGEEMEHWNAGTFVYRNSTFHIVNIDYLVLDMIQGLGRKATEADAVRRHQ